MRLPVPDGRPETPLVDERRRAAPAGEHDVASATFSSAVLVQRPTDTGHSA
jgi:hypothetical protein